MTPHFYTTTLLPFVDVGPWFESLPIAGAPLHVPGLCLLGEMHSQSVDCSRSSVVPLRAD